MLTPPRLKKADTAVHTVSSGEGEGECYKQYVTAPTIDHRAAPPVV